MILLYGMSETAPINVKKWENLIIQFAGQAYKNNCVTIGSEFHDFIKSFWNVGFITNLNFMKRSVWVISVKMLAKSINAHLTSLGNSFFQEISNHQRGYQIFACEASIHDQNGNAINGWKYCADDLHDGLPVVITESEKGVGLPNAHHIPDGARHPIDLDAFKDRQIVEHVNHNPKNRAKKQ